MTSLEIHDAGSRKVYQILENELAIGADEANQITLRSAGVAGRHARIRVLGPDEHWIAAMDGAVAVFGDGPVAAGGRRLHHGDVLQIGRAVLVYQAAGEPKPVVPKRLLAATADPAPPVDSAHDQNAAAQGDASAVRPPTGGGGIIVRPIAGVPTRGGPSPAPTRPRAPGVPAPAAASAQHAPQRAVTPPSGTVRAPVAATPRAASTRSPTSRAPSSRGGLPRIAIASLAILGAIALIAVTVRILGATSGPAARDLLNLAEIKLKAGDIALARSYIDQAERGDVDAALLQEIRTLRAKVDELARAKADLLDMRAARAEFDGRLLRFHAWYLAEDPQRREAAREFVPMVEEWLAAHRDVCSRSSDGRALIQRAEEWRAQFTPIAKLDEAETADDALFAGGRWTRRRDRNNFPQAVAVLDRWLAANPGHARVGEIQKQRAEWVRESKVWFEAMCAEIDRLHREGSTAEAFERMTYIASEAAMPEWSADAQQKLGELQASVK